MAMEPNMWHYSKEIILASHSSYILPKGSPLMVCLNVTGSGHFSILKCVSLFFTARFSKCNYVAKGHRDTEQVERCCDESADVNSTSKSEAQSAPHPETTRDHDDNPYCRPVHCIPGVSRRAVDKQEEK